MTANWTSGNSVGLLENGEEFFPRIQEVIRSARREIILETFILRDDKVGQAIQQELIAAARRGVWISLTVDGYGSYYLPEEFISAMINAGILFQVFDPQTRWISFRTNLFRRLHRKLLIVDNERAFIGGINLAHVHLADYGPDAKQDYAVEVQGPVVSVIREFAIKEIQAASKKPVEVLPLPNNNSQPKGEADVLFVVRDNVAHRNDIEQQYLEAIQQAKKQITIANAYFFPGYRFLRELRNAARRGVKVTLILQGKCDSAWARKFTPTLYDFLVESDIEVYEYNQSPLHAKVAAIDDDWSTVGSSNLDPLSLSLNLEANVMVRDRAFNTLMRERMAVLFQYSESRKINQSWIHRRTLWKWTRSFFIFHFLRHFPAWVGWLPVHSPRLRPPVLTSSVTQPNEEENVSREKVKNNDNLHEHA